MQGGLAETDLHRLSLADGATQHVTFQREGWLLWVGELGKMIICNCIIVITCGNDVSLNLQTLKLQIVKKKLHAMLSINV